MFERNKVDNLPEPTAIPVEIAFADGSLVKGKLYVPAGKLLTDTLNSNGGFVEFEAYGEERSFLAKAQIASLRLVGVPKVPNLQHRQRMYDDFDPYQTLAVSQGASRDEVKQAYHKLSKIYHPDRYANATLPDEVRDYLGAMVRRINAAYSAVETTTHTAKKVAAQRAAAVYTSAARA